MQSNGAKAAVAIISLALIVVLFVVLSGGGDDETTTNPTTTELNDTSGPDSTGNGGPSSGGGNEPDIAVIKVVDGQPADGITDLEFAKGEDVQFEVDSDTASEVHVHGYDVMQDVKAGGTSTFDFPADIDGVFEVELEDTAVQIAELTVTP